MIFKYSTFTQNGNHVKVSEEHSGEGTEAGNAPEEVPVHRGQAARFEETEKGFANQVITNLLLKLNNCYLRLYLDLKLPNKLFSHLKAF